MSHRKLPPMLSGKWPILGHALEFAQKPKQLILRGAQDYGNIFRIRLLNKDAVVVSGATLNKFFYLETDKNLNMSDAYEMLEASFGQVLFIASNDAYENQRPMLQYIFNREHMAKYVVGMQAEVQRWLDSLGDSGQINMTREMQVLAQDIAGHAFLGPNFRDELPDKFWEAYADIGRSLDPIIPSNLPLPKYRARDRAKKYIHDAFRPIIARRRQNPDRYDDLISVSLTHPLKDGTFMDDELITSLFMGLIFAGHETTAGQAAWLIYELCQHPDYLARVQAEIDEAVVPGEPIGGSVLRKLKQTYWAIDETTRLHPSAPLQIRTVNQTFELDGYAIPAGSLMMVHYAHSHFDENVWTNADQFDPDRWSPDRKEGSAFDIIGFGGGKHKCTGMNFAKNEMAIIISHLFQQYELEVLSDDVVTVLNIGASRPSEMMVRYKEKSPQIKAMPQSELALA